MMLVRHGFMIVGDPLGGKTSAWKVLAAALSDLGNDEDSDEVPVNSDSPALVPLLLLFSGPGFDLWADQNPGELDRK